MTTDYVAIYEKSVLARGDLKTVIYKTKAIADDIEPIVFELETCKRIDFSWRGNAQAVIDNLPMLDAQATNKRGRPKLGVKSKEVTLLPRHWEWLSTQRGGASVTLRKLVDKAINNATAEELIKIKQNQLYNLMAVMEDELGFEEASRALYRNSKVSFEEAIKQWPTDFKALMLEKFNLIRSQHDGK